MIKKVVCNMHGRLGNQMFQYAYARKLMLEEGISELPTFNFFEIDENAKDFPENSGWVDQLSDLQIEYEKVSELNGYFYAKYLYPRQRFILKVHRRLMKYFLKTSYYQAFEQQSFLRKGYARFLYSQGLLIYPGKIAKKIKVRSQTVLMDGYFEDADYYKGMEKELRQVFQPNQALLEKNDSFYKKIQNSQSVCVTIRRGDYLLDENKADFFLTDEAYFSKAIEIIKDRVTAPVFFFFSDDLAYVTDFAKKVMKTDDLYYIELENNPVWEKLRLMSACQHFLISNSTFSWWAQYLSKNPNKIVVGPKHWFPRQSINKSDALVEENWVKI